MDDIRVKQILLQLISRKLENSEPNTQIDI